jgi:hypothetical protein
LISGGMRLGLMTSRFGGIGNVPGRGTFHLNRNKGNTNRNSAAHIPFTSKIVWLTVHPVFASLTSLGKNMKPGIPTMSSRLFWKSAIGTVAILLGISLSAFAGPPLICHRIEIGQAKTLPYIDWNQHGTGGYELKNLTRETLAILDSNAPVLVRMETLRLATIYARHDPEAARQLVTRLQARAYGSDGQSEALAWFDLGYLLEAYNQWMPKNSNVATGLDGYAWVKKAIRLRGQADPEMEFAAALITFAGPADEYKKHLRKSVAGARNDPILAQNLASRFGDQVSVQALHVAEPGERRK